MWLKGTAYTVRSWNFWASAQLSNAGKNFSWKVKIQALHRYRTWHYSGQSFWYNLYIYRVYDLLKFCGHWKTRGVSPSFKRSQVAFHYLFWISNWHFGRSVNIKDRKSIQIPFINVCIYLLNKCLHNIRKIEQLGGSHHRPMPFVLTLW